MSDDVTTTDESTTSGNTRLTKLIVRNYKNLRSLDLDLQPLMVFCGPNGGGKSNLLDAISLVAEMLQGDVNTTIRNRRLGNEEALSKLADFDDAMLIEIRSNDVEYQIRLHNRQIGELVKLDQQQFAEREINADSFRFDPALPKTKNSSRKVGPASTFFTSFTDLRQNYPEFNRLGETLRSVRWFDPRKVSAEKLRKEGTPFTNEIELHPNASELWTVFRMLADLREVDNRFNTIIRYMREAFPKLRTILPFPLTPESTYAKFVEEPEGATHFVTQMPHGYLQMLINLTAIFLRLPDNTTQVLIFDEPDLSLHPHAITVLAKAMREAVDKWNRQIFIATHSPVLLSQFEPHETYAVEADPKLGTRAKRVSEIENIQDLLEEYATGSLYMCEMFGPQSSFTANQEPVPSHSETQE